MTPEAQGSLPFIIAAFAVAVAVSFALTPLAIRLATRFGAIDQPDEGRRVHRLPIPRAGGLAVVAAFVGVGIAALWINDQLQAVPLLRAPITTAQLAALFGGCVVAAAFGLLDDRYQILARWQLMVQLGLAALAVIAGITINNIDNPAPLLGGGDPLHLGGEVAVVVSIIWIVGMINSINFIDGLDGLSTGVVLIAAVTLAVLSLVIRLPQPYVALLCAILAGALGGFLPWNFHPAKVFIGTTGVYSVGYALAVLSILGTAKVAVAMLVLGVPIIDTFWIIIRRLSAKQSPFTPDRGHFHHRLLDLGLTHRSAVLVIYAICASLAVLSLILSSTGSLYAFAGIVIGGGLILQLMTRRSREALDARSYPPDEATGP
ncbi:MAG: MraY family glycosyltransferase [Candidatus Limnocylindrales bacterium]